MSREEAVEAMARALHPNHPWSDPAFAQMRGGCNGCRGDAETALDALAPYVVLRDQMEQVGWRDEVGYLHAAPSAANHSQDTPVYIIRGGS